MALQITEFFGREPPARLGRADVDAKRCPFVKDRCIKPKHGACSLKQSTGDAIIACPNRLYGDNYKILSEIADRVFGFTSELIKPGEVRVRKKAKSLVGNEVAVFGRYWGQELPLLRPQIQNSDKVGTYYVDWILARVDNEGTLAEFTAVEVQTIDTTGNYNDQVAEFFGNNDFTDRKGRTPGFSSKGGMNWENVNKRILPQLIYKGQVLRREQKCTKGLFFVCPKQVLNKIKERLGNGMQSYVIANSTITFRSYEIGERTPGSEFRPLVFVEEFITAVDEVARALTFPTNFPKMNIYEAAINFVLDR